MRFHTIMFACALQFVSFSSFAAPQAGPQVYYLMTSFGEPGGNGLRLALSTDGYRWAG